jgi:hypothetical protein
MLTNQAELMNELRSKAELTKEITDRLNKALAAFAEQFRAGSAASVAGASNGASANGTGAHKAAQAHANAA